MLCKEPNIVVARKRVLPQTARAQPDTHTLVHEHTYARTHVYVSLVSWPARTAVPYISDNNEFIRAF